MKIVRLKGGLKLVIIQILDTRYDYRHIYCDMCTLYHACAGLKFPASYLSIIYAVQINLLVSRCAARLLISAQIIFVTRYCLFDSKEVLLRI